MSKNAAFALVLPLFGGVLYVLFNFQTSTRKFQKDIHRAEIKSKNLFTLPDDHAAQAGIEYPEYGYSDNVGEHVYLQIITGARDYLYINTPYLIVDDSMLSALCLAAKSGVDVRIVTPHRWDKWVVHMTTRSYYRELVKAGVKIYEYSTGFIHSKTFVCDDAVATVGTTNLDFRSLYHHFECGTVVYGSGSVKQVKDDFLDTLKICQPITEKDCNPNLFMRVFQDVMRLFAPLM